LRDVIITLTPLNPPIIIPSVGGSFDFDVSVTNQETGSVHATVWFDVTLPDGSLYGPLIGPIDSSLPGGFNVVRQLTQSVPAYAPPGIYTFHGYTGLYPATIWSQDSFNLKKLGS